MFLGEIMKTSEEFTHLFKALCDCKKDFIPLAKNKQGYGYKYSTLDSVIEMLNNILPKYGLGFTQFPSNDGENYSLTTRIFHESGEWMEDTIAFAMTEISKANDTQKLGASITYFRRYTLSAIFGIASDEDVDGNISNIKATQSDERGQQKKQFYERTDRGESKSGQQQQLVKIFSEELYNGIPLTVEEKINDSIKKMIDFKYKDNMLFTEKSTAYIAQKAKTDSFASADEYYQFIRKVGESNKKRIDSVLSQQD